MQPNPHATLDKVPELLTLQFPVDISSAGVLYFRRGLRCKQAGLFVLLATPVTALLGWQVALRPIWAAPLVVLATAAGVDSLGRILIWMSGVGHRPLIAASVAAQAVGLIMGTCFIVSVPGFGLPLGLTLAAILQVVAALTFTNFLAGVGRQLGDTRSTQKATRSTVGILSVLVSLAGLGGVSLLVGAVLAVITIFTAGYGLYLALPVVWIVLLASSAPLLYFVTFLYWHYAGLLSQLGATVAASSPRCDSSGLPQIDRDVIGRHDRRHTEHALLPSDSSLKATQRSTDVG